MTTLTVCALALAVVAGVRGTWSPCGLSMVSSINPFTEAARGHRYGVTCAWFVTGAVLGGLALGAGTAALALLAGALSTAAALGIACAAALLTLGSDLRIGGFALPVHPRQVEETWLRTYRPWVYAGGFGLQIGLGFTTYIMTAATYLVVVLGALTGSPATALATGALFGLVRGLAVLLGLTAPTPERLRDLHRRIDELDAPALRGAMAAQALVAVAAAATLGGLAGAVAATAVVALLAARPDRVVMRRFDAAHS